MATDHTPQGQGRRHFHRGRRGPDRRAPDRRGPQAAEGGGRDHVDVEQIMRDIRSRIAQRHGVELTNQQIHDLASRRLESILDIRSLTPELLAQFRRATGITADAHSAAPIEAPFSFDDSTLFGAHGGVLALVRRILKPILRLFIDPEPLVGALKAQATLNTDLLARDGARERQQAEWNALHYELLQRLVTEVSRVSLEMQSLSMRVEALSAKVDFNERRVRNIEGATHQSRPSPRMEAGAPVAPPPAEAAGLEATNGAQTVDAPRRRRRRRRGRRSGSPGEPTTGSAPVGLRENDADDDLEGEEAEEESVVETAGGSPTPVDTAEASPPPLDRDPMPPRDEPPAPDPRSDQADPNPTDR